MIRKLGSCVVILCLVGCQGNQVKLAQLEAQIKDLEAKLAVCRATENTCSDGEDDSIHLPELQLEACAKSMGGVVRDGPGIEFQKIQSLNLGTPITLTFRSGVEMNGYPWFKIRTNNGVTGYQWGALICSCNDFLPGVYQACD